MVFVRITPRRSITTPEASPLFRFSNPTVFTLTTLGDQPRDDVRLRRRPLWVPSRSAPGQAPWWGTVTVWVIAVCVAAAAADATA